MNAANITFLSNLWPESLVHKVSRKFAAAKNGQVNIKFAAEINGQVSRKFAAGKLIMSTLEPEILYLAYLELEVTSSAIVGLNAFLASPNLP